MTQQYSSRAQRIIMIITLLILVLVIAKNVAAGTTSAATQKTIHEECTEKTDSKVLLHVQKGIRDFAWHPFLSFFH